MIPVSENHPIYNKLMQIVSKENIAVDKPLKEYTYTRLGGCADFFVTPETYEEVRQVVLLAKEESIPFTLLGNGSNLIIRDGGIRGIVLNLGKLNAIEVKEDQLIAQSGARIIQASQVAMHHKLTGLEFACGIPGSVGGALFMNAGAYGGEVKDVLESTLVVDRNGTMKRLLTEDLNLQYRSSNIPEKGYIVLEATFSLKFGDQKKIKAKMDDLTFKRESKQPLEYPSCGSVFKRPPGHYAGKLIQDSGLQGKQIGGAKVSSKHAGFIVNVDGCTAKEYIALIHYVQKKVKEKFGVTLEREVRIIGED